MTEEVNNIVTPETVKPEAPATPIPAVGTKVFPEDYVQSLREENKSRRLKEKALEAQLRRITGLKDDEDVDDAKIASYLDSRQAQLDAVIGKANDRILKAAIKGLGNEGFDVKLFERLLPTEKSKITFDDEGEPVNLLEIAEAMAKEFPKLKDEVAKGSGANPPLGSIADSSLEEEYNEAVKNGNTAKVVSIKQRMFNKK